MADTTRDEPRPDGREGLPDPDERTDLPDESPGATLDGPDDVAEPGEPA
jgi:hypothetical protein